jgi:hypothetical protein
MYIVRVCLSRRDCGLEMLVPPDVMPAAFYAARLAPRDHN